MSTRMSHRTDWPVGATRRGWTADEISKDGQSFDLTGEQIDRLTILVKQFDGRPFRTIEPGQFRHPAFDALFERMVEELKWGKGVVFLRGLPVDRLTHDELRRLYWGIGTHFGTALSQKKFTGEYMLDISPKAEAGRGFDGHHELELHTDYAEIGSLFCLQPSISGGINVYASSLKLWDIIERECPEHLPVMKRGFRVWRLNEHTPGDDPISPDPAPIFGEVDGLRSVYNNWYFAEAVAAYDGGALSQVERAAIAVIRPIVGRSELQFRAPLERGEIVFYNNFEVFHARTAIGPSTDPARSRHLLRLWLQADPPRRLPRSMLFHHNRSGLQGYDPFEGSAEEAERRNGDDPANLFMRQYFAEEYAGRVQRLASRS